MSLFGQFGLTDDENDPFFGGHMRHMNSFMNSMMGDPFSMMSSMGFGFPSLGNSLLPSPGHRRQQAGGQMMPFGFPNLNNMLQNFEQIGNGGNCHTFSHNTVMTMTSGPDGRPQMYQASSSTRTAPGGVKETKKTLCDTRTGTKKMAIGHHIGDRAHIMEREQNILSGERDEREELINLDEEEAESFNREFEQKVRHYGQLSGRALMSGSSGRVPRHRDLPALPPASSSHRVRARDSRRDYPAIASPSKVVEVGGDAGRAKKRDHEPEHKEGSRLKMRKRGPAVINISKEGDGCSDASDSGDR